MSAETSTKPKVTFTCARCSRQSTDPVGDHWILRAVPLIVAGITLGVCCECATGHGPSDSADAEPKSCGGSCKGDFRPAVGTYFEAILRGSWSTSDEKWACWDAECVDSWAEEHGGDCETCGHDRDVDVRQYENGKRVAS